MINRSAFEQTRVPVAAAPLVLLAPATAAERALADAAIRALSRLTGASVVCRLTALAGGRGVAEAPADVRLTLGARGAVFDLSMARIGEAGGSITGALAGRLAGDAVAVAVAAADLAGLAHPGFGRPCARALAAEAETPGQDALVAALPEVWIGSESLAPLVAALPSGEPQGVAAALEARRCVLAFRTTGEGSRDAVASEVDALLDRARSLASRHDLAAWGAGVVDAMFTRRYADGAAAFRAALAEDACNAAVLQNAAMAFTYALEFDLALWAVRRAEKVSPADGQAAQRGFAGALAAFHGQRFDTCVAFADAALAARPGFTNVLRLKAAALAHLGRGDAARAAMASAMAADPSETVARNAAVNPLREYAGFHRFLDALAEAGMPA